MKTNNAWAKGKRGVTLAAAVAGCLALGACATAQKGPGADKNAHADGASDDDPLEGYNRFMFKVNDAVDQAVIQPVAVGYRKVIPEPVRMGVRNFLHNLRTPVNAANNLLQGDIQGMAADLSRFTINTSIGLGGLIDVAKDTGLRYKPEDFGQTLGVWGVGHGPYLVLPILGPSSFRDTTGLIVDSYADPVRLWLFNTHHENLYYIRGGMIGLDQREAVIDAVYDLRKHSFDYYAATRSAYFQERDAMLRTKRSHHKESAAPTEPIPDYSDPHNK
jgi:phospholipid-binding lipoprotein MlaA